MSVASCSVTRSSCLSRRARVLRAARSSALPARARSTGADSRRRGDVSGGGREVRGPPAEVLVDAARQHRDLAVAEQRPHRVGDPLEEVAVVGDDDEGAGPAVEEVLEDVEGVDVEVVGGLVEQQHVGLGHQQPQQLEASPLAAGQVADPRGEPVAGEAEPLEQRAGGDLAATRCARPA